MLGETASYLRSFVVSHSWVKGFHARRLRHTFGGLVAGTWRDQGNTPGSVGAIRSLDVVVDIDE
jgi:hypothetical protein